MTQSDPVSVTYPKKASISSVKESEIARMMEPSHLESLPAELLQEILQGLSLEESAALSLVSRKIRAVALRSVQKVSNQRWYQLSQILPLYRSYVNKHQVHELKVIFFPEFGLNNEKEELTQLMQLLAFWEWRRIQIATFMVNHIPSDQWFGQFTMVASNSLSELNFSFPGSPNKTKAVLHALLSKFVNLNILRINYKGIILLEPSWVWGDNHRNEDYPKHESLIHLNIRSTTGDLGIDINFFKRTPKLRKVCMYGDIRDIEPKDLYKKLIEYCPNLEKITYIDVGFEPMWQNNIKVMPKMYGRPQSKLTVLEKEDRKPSGAKIIRTFLIHGDDRIQLIEEHVKAILTLYHAPLTTDEVNAMSKELIRLVSHE
ncbi:hypothetical protein BJV82DRAFT_667650 [Fennellomyces sp. T-0311]|nr:hypothetical protein BJV82DRAFT_667650 [Fennellomyces sp. T-0311]